MGFRMGDSVKDYLVWPAGLSLNVSFLTSIQSKKFSFHDYLCGWSLWHVFSLSPPQCSFYFQPFIFHLLSLFPPWSLKAIIISLHKCQNPTLQLYLEEPYWDEWNSSPTKMSGSLRPTLNFLILEPFKQEKNFFAF